MTSKKVPITVANGDGIGPEIMAVTLDIMKEAGANVEIHHVDIGEKVYLKGQPTGIEPSTWETIRHSKGFLKAPITTPQGGGFKSLNVTIRTTLGLYANIRPCVSYFPFVQCKHPQMDVVIIRENEEDLYTGIEYRQTPGTYEALKFITSVGSEKIIRFAFEYARANQRKKVTCFTKDNIMKFTDGEFHKIFDKIAVEYPDIQNEHWIVDIGAAKLADTPENFDVVVMPNLYGDILSDVAAQIAGSVGLAGSANIGEHGAMFEAIHGSAPRRAGQNMANPSGLILASVLMLAHIEQPDVAELIHNAWLKTIEDGIHTYDIFKANTSKEKVGCKEFGQAVIQRLGQKPDELKAVKYGSVAHRELQNLTEVDQGIQNIQTIGTDIFVQFQGSTDELVRKLQALPLGNLKLTMIANRGSKVWPHGHPETYCSDNWRCRFMSKQKNETVSPFEISNLLEKMAQAKVDFLQMHLLRLFDGKPGYTLGQDEQ